MGEELLATAGETIKLWNSSYSLCQEIPFENGNVQGLTWNQDGQCLASLGELGEEIILSAVNAKSAANIGVVRGVESPSCLKFANRVPHYLGVGTGTGTVTIWNVKSQAKKKAFNVTDGPISRLCFSHNDSHITVATKKGSLYCLSVVNNATSGPFNLFKNQTVMDLTYSHIRKSLVGCCTDAGGMTLFDTHAGKMVHSVPQAHAAPAAALAFSPINEFLMVTVGYDKKLICFNVQTKAPLMTHRSSAPLTSVTFLSEGQKVALGTMTGQVFVHDLRCLSPPLATFQAHSSHIRALLRQPTPRTKSDSTYSEAKKANQLTAISNNKPSKSWSDQGEGASKVVRERKPNAAGTDSKASTPEVFSPIRSNSLKGAQTSVDPPPPPMGDLSDGSSPGMHDVFSPIRQTITTPAATASAAITTSASPRLQKWTQSVDEMMDDVLSPIRNTEPLASPSGRELPATPFPQISIYLQDSPATQQDKENIKPSPGREEGLSDMLETSQDNKMTPRTPNTRPTREQFDLDDVLSPLRISGVAQENVGTGEGKMDVCTPSNLKNQPQQQQQQQQQSSPVAPDSDCKKNKHMVPTSPARDDAVTKLAFSTPAVLRKGEHWSQNAFPTSKTRKDTTITPSHPSASVLPRPYNRVSPPKKKQLLSPMQSSELLPESCDAGKDLESCGSSAVPFTEGGGRGWGVQVDLVRSCVAEVVEEFHDDINRRLLHLQYVVTKQFLRQQEVMEELHRQYSVNEEVLEENERLRQEIAHLRAKY